MSIAATVLGGATTMLARTATRKVINQGTDASRLPQAARRQGLGAMLAWAVAAGVILALADLLIERRKGPRGH